VTHIFSESIFIFSYLFFQNSREKRENQVKLLTTHFLCRLLAVNIMASHGFAALNEASLSQFGTDRGEEANEEETLRTSTEDEDASVDPRLLQDETLRAYNEALSLHGAARYEMAVQAFRRTLDTQLLAKMKKEADASARLLRYNSLKYLGYGLAEIGEHREAATALLTAATDLEAEASTDVNMYYRLGGECVKAKEPELLPAARRAFERALVANSEHWPSLEMACLLTHKTGDLVSCLSYCGHALRRNPENERIRKLAASVVASQPQWKCLCPSITEEDVAHAPQMAPVGPPPLPSGLASDCHSFSFACSGRNWSDFLSTLLSKHAEVEARPNTPLPSRVRVEFQDVAEASEDVEPPAKEGDLKSDATENPRTAKADATSSKTKEKDEGDVQVPAAVVAESQDESRMVEVSVQNIVNEMLDLVSVGAAKLIAQSLIDDVVADAIFCSSKTVVDCILDDVLTDVASVAKESETTVKRQRSSFASIVAEIPTDLLDVRRSTRMRGGGSSELSVMESARVEETTAQSILESFIPSSLLNAIRDDPVVVDLCWKR